MLAELSKHLRPFRHTLYPAAYPKPGNKEVNFLPTDALALSLKMTWFNFAGVILPSLLINRFAIVSTGWNIASSAIPALPLPRILAALDSFLKSFADTAGPTTASTTFGAISSNPSDATSVGWE